MNYLSYYGCSFVYLNLSYTVTWCPYLNTDRSFFKLWPRFFMFSPCNQQIFNHLNYPCSHREKNRRNDSLRSTRFLSERAEQTKETASERARLGSRKMGVTGRGWGKILPHPLFLLPFFLLPRRARSLAFSIVRSVHLERKRVPRRLA